MRIYVAGPIRQGDLIINTRKAIEVGDALALKGHVPFIPHAHTCSWHLLFPHDIEFWMRQDEEWLRHCDALFRIEGPSVGADQEVAWAEALGMPIYRQLDDVPIERRPF